MLARNSGINPAILPHIPFIPLLLAHLATLRPLRFLSKAGDAPSLKF